MINIKVDLNGKIYPLFIGIDILAKIGEIYKLYGYKSRAVLITDFTLKESSYFNIIFENFKKINIEVIPIFLMVQRPENGLSMVEKVAEQLMKHQFKANETIISLGGSLVNNVSAFISKIIYGGVSYFQIPTTLTAQVVQSVAPICYLNSASVMNLFSTKYEHSLVWSDVALLKSLPEKNIISGLGHLIHYAYLHDSSMFEFLEKNLKEIMNLNLEVIEETITRSCQKRITISEDERNQQKNPKSKGFGEFSASFIIESTQNSIKYGEALLLGMLIEAIVAFRSGVFIDAHFERLYQLLKQVPFYHFIYQIDPQKLIECLKDNISSVKRLTFFLPQEVSKFTSYNESKLADLFSAIELVFAN
jgi:3-dehydroquinate synthase